MNDWSRPRILKFLADAGLIDPGANICMTNALEPLKNLRRLPIPLKVGVAVEGRSEPQQSTCTHVGDLPIRLSDGRTHYQRCYYNPDATETFISPQAIVESSDVLVHWTMRGSSLPTQGGALRIESEDGQVTLDIPLSRRNGLYYCQHDFLSMDRTPLADVNTLHI